MTEMAHPENMLRGQGKHAEEFPGLHHTAQATQHMPHSKKSQGKETRKYGLEEGGGGSHDTATGGRGEATPRTHWAHPNKLPPLPAEHSNSATYPLFLGYPARGAQEEGVGRTAPNFPIVRGRGGCVHSVPDMARLACGAGGVSGGTVHSWHSLQSGWDGEVSVHRT